MSASSLMLVVILGILAIVLPVSALCPYSCANGGTCNSNSNTCTCAAGFVGVDCTRRGCASNCNHVGYCDLSSSPPSCLCFNGFAGLDCELSVNPVSNSTSNSTALAAAAAAAGSNNSLPLDSRKRCTPSCDRAHGVCWQGACACANGYTGRTCSDRLCTDDCNGRGVCQKTTGTCECYDPYTGPTCAGQSKPLTPRQADTIEDVHGPATWAKGKQVNAKYNKPGQSNAFHLIEEDSHMQLVDSLEDMDADE